MIGNWLQPIHRTAIFAALLFGVAMGLARAEPAVDVALVLAVDVSLSIDAEEFALQRAGYAAAFRNRRVGEAITAGAAGAGAGPRLPSSAGRQPHTDRR